MTDEGKEDEEVTKQMLKELHFLSGKTGWEID